MTEWYKSKNVSAFLIIIGAAGMLFFKDVWRPFIPENIGMFIFFLIFIAGVINFAR